MTGPHTAREIGSPILKSPLDTNNYKLVQLCENGLKTLLISTLIDSSPKKGKVDKATCAFKEIQEFNEKHLGIKHKDPIPNSDKPDKAVTTESKVPPNKNLSPEDEDDPNSDLIKVGLLVGSGMVNDPVDIPGMAHFVEHGMFLGSEKYPELGFAKFIQNHGGDIDAVTNPETTFYRFSIHMDYIEEALRIFSDFITNPIFDEKQLKEEIETMESEFIISKLYDDFRYLVLLRSCATPNHPMSKIHLGSRKSLSNIQDLKERVTKWKKKHYLAGNMVFAIRGKLPIDELEQLVINHCGSIPHCHCSLPERKHLANKFAGIKPFDLDKWNRMFFVVPILDQKWIKFAWILPHKAGSTHETKPKHFLSYLFTSKVDGSLDHYLRQQGWLISICSGCPEWDYMSTSFCSIFSLSLELTEKGMQNRKKVVCAIFSYIKMLQRSKTDELRRIFDEMKQVNSDTFHYISDGNLTDPVNDLFINQPSEMTLKDFAEVVLTEVKPEAILMSKMVTIHFDELLIRRCLEDLNPKNTNFMIGGQSFHSICSSEEDIYNIKYLARKLQEKFIIELSKIQQYNEFFLPPPNKFVLRSLCFPMDPAERLEFEEDEVVLEDNKIKITFSNLECKKGHLPSAVYKVNFTSPYAADENKLGVIPYMDVWIQCLHYILEIKMAQALSSLFSFDLSFEEGVLTMEVKGPSEKLPELFETMITTFQNFKEEISSNIFENMAEAQIADYDNFSMEGASFADELKKMILYKNYAMAGEHSAFLQEIPYTKFMNFLEDFQHKMNVTVDLQGCVSKSEADNVTQKIKSLEYSPWLSYRNFISEELPSLNRAIKLPLGERCFRVMAKNKHESSHWICNHYQIGHLDDVGEILLMDILFPAMRISAFLQLRTKEQLAYHVNITTDIYHGVYGLNVEVYPPAEKFTTDYIDERIDNFIGNFYKEKVLVLENYKKHLDPGHLYLDDYGISWKDVKDFYQRYFLACGSDFRKLSIQIVGFFDDSSSGVSSQPKQGVSMDAKLKKYSSEKTARAINTKKRVEVKSEVQSESLPYTLDVPKRVREANGYFITNVRSFKISQHCYAVKFK